MTGTFRPFSLGVAAGLIIAPLAYIAGGLLGGWLHEVFVG